MYQSQEQLGTSIIAAAPRTGGGGSLRRPSKSALAGWLILAASARRPRGRFGGSSIPTFPQKLEKVTLGAPDILLKPVPTLRAGRLSGQPFLSFP